MIWALLCWAHGFIVGLRDGDRTQRASPRAGLGTTSTHRPAPPTPRHHITTGVSPAANISPTGTSRAPKAQPHMSTSPQARTWHLKCRQIGGGSGRGCRGTGTGSSLSWPRGPPLAWSCPRSRPGPWSHCTEKHTGWLGGRQGFWPESSGPGCSHTACRAAPSCCRLTLCPDFLLRKVRRTCLEYLVALIQGQVSLQEMGEETQKHRRGEAE